MTPSQYTPNLTPSHPNQTSQCCTTAQVSPLHTLVGLASAAHARWPQPLVTGEGHFRTLGSFLTPTTGRTRAALGILGQN